MKTMDEAVGALSDRIEPLLASHFEDGVDKSSVEFANAQEVLNDIFQSERCLARLMGLFHYYVPQDTPVEVVPKLIEMVNMAFAIGITVGQEMQR